MFSGTGPLQSWHNIKRCQQGYMPAYVDTYWDKVTFKHTNFQRGRKKIKMLKTCGVFFWVSVVRIKLVIYQS